MDRMTQLLIANIMWFLILYYGSMGILKLTKRITKGRADVKI